MTKEIHLYVGPEGDVEFVHDDDVMEALAGQGRAMTHRASHVEPDFDSGYHDGRTRWKIDLGPTLRPGEPYRRQTQVGLFDRREEALEAERHWLEWHFTYGASVMTKNQLERTIALKQEGWRPAGLAGDPEAVGSIPVMIDRGDRPHKVMPDGEVVPLDEGEGWHLPTKQT